MVFLQSELLLLCICNWLTVVRTRNPIFFPCENDTFSVVVDCKYRALRSMPSIKSDSVLSLNMDGNNIQRLSNNSLAGVPNLQNFSMMWNCPPGKLKGLGTPPCHVYIESAAFVNLKNLTHLFLGGNSMKSIPRLPERLEVLGLEYNNLYRITESLQTTGLKQLFLVKNCYYENPCNQSFYISESVFQDLPELQNLTLGFNNLTAVPLGLPRSLESLDLRENKISKINETVFINLTNLIYLNLEWNCQRCDHAAQPCFPCTNNTPINLDSMVFKNQKKLTYLSLRGNSLKSLPEGLFRELHHLTSLDLSDNILAYTITNGTFFRDLKNVRVLNLIYNYEPRKTFPTLTLSPYFCEMASLETLLLSGYFFLNLSKHSLSPLLNLRNLSYLDFRMNFISECDLKMFSSIKSLKKVILSQNMLDFVSCCADTTNQSNSLNKDQQDSNTTLCPQTHNSKDRPLQLDCEHLQDLNMFFFEEFYCHKKEFLDLSQNNILTLKQSIFVGMDSVVCLDLSQNYLSQSLNGRQFRHLKSLKYLNMAHNRLDLYYDTAFQEMRNTLKVLDLTNNDFHFRMKGMGHRFEFIQNLTSLEALSLSENNIGIRISVQLHSSSLKFLFFSGNRLDIMWETGDDMYLKFFNNLTNLVYLDISKNHLKSFRPEAFCNLPRKLKTLKVDNNQLNYFPWHNLTFLNHLCCLNLSNNLLRELPTENIRFGNNLTVLDLSYNKIHLLSKAFFQNASSLRYLFLNDNQLNVLDTQSLFPQLSSLQKLTLHRNPFMCSCDSSDFMKFLRDTIIQIPYLTTDIRCGFPETQHGETVLSMDRRSCQEIYGSIGFLCTSFLVIVFTLVPLLKKLYGWDLWYGLQVLWAGHKGYSQLQEKQGQHDAFIVFDTANTAVRDWVYNDLTVNLEDRGRQRFTLCLEERDWIPGLSCIENLHNAVYNSKKTVFVLTCASAVSGVPRQAFFMVQQRLLDEKIDAIVLVLMDEVFPKSKYLQMRKMICRRSVLSWPRNPHAHQHFWNKMRAVLTSDNRCRYNFRMSDSLLPSGLI